MPFTIPAETVFAPTTPAGAPRGADIGETQVWAIEVEENLGSLDVGYDISYETRAQLYADLAWPADSIGRVFGDATAAYIGVYKKSGASGAGSWAKIGELPAEEVNAANIAATIVSVAGKTTPADADTIPLIDSAASSSLKELTWANLKAAIWSALGALIAGGTSKATPVDDDAFAIADSAASSASKKVTWVNVKAGVWTAFGALVAGGTAKTTPVDADTIALSDSAASNASKKVTWANVKATIWTSFGALIAGGTGKTTPVDADTFPLSDSAASDATKKLTWANLLATIWTRWGGLVAVGTDKATPVDADSFALSDSAASNATKKLTFANLKATMLSLGNRSITSDDLFALRALRELFPFTTTGGGFQIGDSAGNSVFEIDSDGKMHALLAPDTMSGSILGDTAVYEKTVSTKQQVFAVTGDGETQISDGVANDRAPVIIGDVVSFISDRQDATPRAMRMLKDGKSLMSLHGSPVVYLVIAMGQSTAIGSNGGETPSAYTTVADYLGSVLRFNRGVRVNEGNIGTLPQDGVDIVVDSSAIDRLVPLTAVADSIYYGETHLETACYRLFESDEIRSIASAVGVGGARIEYLMKEAFTDGNGAIPYANGLAVARRAQEIVSKFGWRLEVVVTWDQGESSGTLTRAAYKALLLQLYDDLAVDLKEITGQEQFHFFLAQTSSLNQSGVPLAQLDASKERDNVYCVGPSYQLPFLDINHPTFIGYTRKGDQYWRAFKKVLVDGLKYKPLQPISAIRTGTTIDVLFEGQTGNVVLNTTLVASITNSGLEYFDDTSPPAITNVATITGGVRITLASTPTGANPVVRGGWTKPGVLPSPTGGARTNICDQDTMLCRQDSTAMPNWCVHFEIPVT